MSYEEEDTCHSERQELKYLNVRACALKYLNVRACAGRTHTHNRSIISHPLNH
jgi:hypothetical protein